MRRWSDLTREEIAEIAPRAVVVVPVASTEQHGPHLATTTDTAILDAILDLAGSRIAESTVMLRAPTLCYGTSEHHLPFGGTLSLSPSTFNAVLRDILRSLVFAHCSRILIVNGHGGNDSIARSASAEMATTHGVVVAMASYWHLVDPPLAFSFPGHAGEAETSMMLAIDATLVRMNRARPSPGTLPSPIRGVQLECPDLWHRIDGFTDNPERAKAETGRLLLDRCADATAAAIDALAAREETP